MNQIQKKLITSEIILLDKKDIREITGWGENIINKLFSNEKEFPAIKIGKKYLVELDAFKNYLSVRRTGISTSI